MKEKEEADVFIKRRRQRGEHAEKLYQEYCQKLMQNAVLQIKVPRATPGNVKDREIFKRDEDAISLITSEEKNDSFRLNFNQYKSS